MMPTDQAEFSSALLPARADVVIIGGGIVGVSAALYLAKKGVSVALCEKGRIAGEQSSRNWGWCRTMGRDEAELPLAIESLRLWERMNRGRNRLSQGRHRLSLRKPKRHRPIRSLARPRAPVSGRLALTQRRRS